MIGFLLPRAADSAIGSGNLHRNLNQSDAELRTIAT